MEAFLARYQFQLTRSRGAWLVSAKIIEGHANFNSHAHVERDNHRPIFEDNLSISTHTLTWSVTDLAAALWTCTEFQLTRSRGAWLFIFHEPIESYHISTHTLTWSVTDLAAALWTCTEFQLTRSRGAWLLSSCIARCHSAFQLTRSRGAWHSLL